MLTGKRFPSVLMKDVRVEFSKATVKLEGPDSKVYNVSATQQTDDEIVLQSGWDAFVIAHHIQEGDLIIFRYKGNCHLEVFIIGQNVFHKASSCFGTGDVSNTQETCDGSVEIIDPPHKTIDVIDPEDIQSAMDTRVDQSPLSFNNSEGPSHPLYMISKTLTSPRAQEVVLQKAQAIRSRFPIYVAVSTGISTGQKGYLMRFGREYARRCLPSSTQGLMLELEGCQSKEWQTVLHVQGGHSRSSNDVIVYHGWEAFASDNHLRLGDICLFELVSVITRLKMKVHIIHKLDGCM